MTLHTHLKQHHTVRMIDGVEVEKPEQYENWEEESHYRFLENGTTLTITWAIECKRYFDAAEVIKLPNWMEFVNKVESEIMCTVNGGEEFALVSDYATKLYEPPTLFQFVAVGENGEVLEEPKEDEYIFGVGKKPRELITDPQYEEDLKQYQAAQSNVIYEGWQVDRVSPSGTVVLVNRNTTIVFSPGQISIVDEDFIVQRVVKTTDDLNRECQLYMKIK